MVNFPFGVNDEAPILISDSLGNIHAFWINRNNALFYSRVFADDFSQGGSWRDYQELAESVGNFSVEVDNQEIIHIVYVKTLPTGKSPPGIYYRTSKDAGSNWDLAQLLYQSLYFRAQSPEQTNVKLTVTENGSIYVVWDNRTFKNYTHCKICRWRKYLDRTQSPYRSGD